MDEKFTSRPIVFIAGCSFLCPTSGLAARTALMFRLLAELCASGPCKLLLSPHSQDELNQYGYGTWKAEKLHVAPVPRSPQERVRVLISRKCRAFVNFHLNPRRPGTILPVLCNSPIVPYNRVQSVLGDFPNAVVCVVRADNAQLVYARDPRQFWILDTNDTVKNLFETYHMGYVNRLLVGLRKDSFMKKLKSLELQLSRLFDRVIAISASDLGYYKESGRENAFMEDTCCVCEAWPKRENIKYDIGFLGGNHIGAIGAAENLMRVVSRDRYKGCSIAIAGEVCNALVNRDTANIKYIGRVSSSLSFFAQCRAVILLSPGETGTSVKFQEAVLSGAFVIANRDAARWSLAVPGRDFHLAESSEDVDKLLSGIPTSSVQREFPQAFKYAAFKERMMQGCGWDREV